ncbi:hypothetical protein EDF24_0950 [Curtobacterium sp. PhB130]|uniref:hypothetical protein n=1 Tax=unclassified Curtobacterium TaxID=257496 RepID=UPI000FBAB08C|nr:MULTISPECIES: hypothetical protein [unclassified Curtobacterium]ROP65239.1 hypothetical protein EDF55_1895 [Curtobacterium sp. ZW137]ROS78179.1 hypothetical protein EDF24_0950 [Curtobacterium sp. PhB130]TCK65502.1 hypothetical protein EDF27_0242 [Curtobacterium sp. PhB136]
MTSIRLATMGVVVLVATLLLTFATADVCWVAAVPLLLSVPVAGVLAAMVRDRRH